MIVSEIIERLLVPGTPFALVEGANELAEVTGRPKVLPAAYVYVATEASKPCERATGPILQRTETDIAVVIVTENLSSKSDVAIDIDSLKAWVRGKLVGFAPDSASDPLEHVVGQIQQAKDKMVWFEDVYATAVLLEEQP